MGDPWSKQEKGNIERSYHHHCFMHRRSANLRSNFLRDDVSCVEVRKGRGRGLPGQRGVCGGMGI